MCNIKSGSIRNEVHTQEICNHSDYLEVIQNISLITPRGECHILKQLLSDKHIAIRDFELDWKQAVVHAAEPLLNDGSIEQCYIDNIIQNVENHGPYIVLTDGFALAHAEAGVGVNRLGISYLQLSNDVDMSGKPVSMFLILACIDKSSHLDALAELTDIMVDPVKFETMKSGSKDEMLALFQ